jgi:xanthine/CO dehydrogenase XdhC/CoxF family maturation factor
VIKDQLLEFHSQIKELRLRQELFALATVVKVHGSASARIGSKAIFDREGHNIFGWIGGGCAERFVGEQAVEALSEKRGRVVLADLDDEIFGLGVACGGKMEVFIDPITPHEKIRLPLNERFQKTAEDLCAGYDVSILWEGSSPANTPSQYFLEIASAFARARHRSGKALRATKDLLYCFKDAKKSGIPVVSLLGRGRIIEALEKHFALVDFEIHSIDSPNQNRPTYKPGQYVVIASHSARDRNLVQEALAQDVAYVGMIGSRKRAIEIMDHLEIKEGSETHHPIYVPAGLDIDARNPEEIALSVVSQVLTFQGLGEWI